MTRGRNWVTSVPLALLVSSALMIVCQTASGVFPVGTAYAQSGTARRDQKIGKEAARQMREFAEEKNARTPAQKKIDSQLLYALKQKRGETRGVPTTPVDIKLDPEGKTLVDITCPVSEQLVISIEQLGGEVVSKSERYHTIRARVALEQLECIASLKDVRFISPPAQAQTQGGVTNN
ncbi:MAG: hypothetical protein WKH64_18235 [Chloroflexia bacterium]